MASVKLEHLTKTHPNGFQSVKNVSLQIEDGEFVTFHGPSGCGKSTILRMIGGIEDITSGEIYLGNDLLNDVLPRDRHVAMLFPNFALYPQLNVFENIALGLRLRNLPENIINTRVKTAAEFFEISDLLDSKIKSLSELQKQRIGLAKAIVFYPKVILVDENFAHDDDIRHFYMIQDILKINEKLGFTILYVTNDGDEALALRKKIVYMNRGEITNIKEAEEEEFE